MFLFISFHMLSSTSENYLSPALTKLSSILNCTETLAGVTLVALGNGAPDVLVAIAGGSSGGDDISFTIGSIFGAGLFVTSITLALVLDKAGGEISPNKSLFLRDTIFYFIGTSTIIAYGFIGYVTWWMALMFLSLYFVFFGYVLYQER